jgi:hypothetical protein
LGQSDHGRLPDEPLLVWGRRLSEVTRPWHSSCKLFIFNASQRRVEWSGKWSQVVWRCSSPRGARASRAGSPPPSGARRITPHRGTRRLAPAAAPSHRPLSSVGIVTGDEPDELVEFRHETVAAYNALGLTRSVDPLSHSRSGTVPRRRRARVLSLELSTTT